MWKNYGFIGQNYWDRLDFLYLLTWETPWYERYRIIYPWKILEGIVPNLSTEEKSSS